MIIKDMSYQWLTWGVSRVPQGGLPPDVLARIEADRQRAGGLPLVARRIPIHWTKDRSLGKRGHDSHYRLHSSWRRFAEHRFNERHVYLEAFGGKGCGPGFAFKDVRIYLDGAIVGRAWRGACSLGFGGGVGPAVAMLRADLAIRVDLKFGIDQGPEELELLGLARSGGRNRPAIPGRPPRTPEEQSILDVVARSRGQAYVDRWAESILAQARQIGDL